MNGREEAEHWVGRRKTANKIAEAVGKLNNKNAFRNMLKKLK